jgi:hypothetical protein
MNLQYCGHILEKYWNIKVYEKVPLGAQLFYVGWQTDGRKYWSDEAHNRF